jgi:hypothetical protein
MMARGTIRVHAGAIVRAAASGANAKAAPGQATFFSFHFRSPQLKEKSKNEIENQVKPAEKFRQDFPCIWHGGALV